VIGVADDAGVRTGKQYGEAQISITSSITTHLVKHRSTDYSSYVRFNTGRGKLGMCNAIDFNFTNCICV
jgi:hypothetical protein